MGHIRHRPGVHIWVMWVIRQTRMVVTDCSTETVVVTKHLCCCARDGCFEKLILTMTTDYVVTTKFLVVVMTQRMSLIQVDPKFVELIAFHPSICPLSWLIAQWEVTHQYHLPRCHISG